MTDSVMTSGASVSSVSLPLNNVTSGQPIILAAISSGASSLTDTFESPYTWNYLGPQEIFTDGYFIQVWFGTGGKGTSGTIELGWTGAQYVTAIAGALGGASAKAATSALQGTTGPTANNITAPQVVPTVSGQLGVFISGVSPSDPPVIQITGVPAGPYSNILVPFGASSGADPQLCLTLYPNMQVGNAYQPTWSLNGGGPAAAVAFMITA